MKTVETKGRVALATALGMLVGVFGLATLGAGEMPAGCPMHAQHMKAAAAADASQPDYAAVDARGDQVMGFSHMASSHHFLLTGTGGVIEVNANNPGDEPNRAQIRAHLQKVASDFAAGDFGMPLAVHGKMPAGVDAMRASGAAIRYQYLQTDAGGRVELASEDTQARAAIHAFLRYQIVEHRTGDSLEPDQTF